MCFVTVAFFAFSLWSTYCEGKLYSNHALLRGVPYNFEDLELFKNLDRLYNVTFWKKPTLVHNDVEFSISPHNLAELYRDTSRLPVHFTTVTRNIQRAFDKQKARPYSVSHIQSFNWHTYYRLDDIYHWLRNLSDIYPDEVRLRDIGKSYENRTILAVKLTLKGSIRRSKVIVEGGCHGNEWISPAFVTYMLHTLLNAKNYDNEELERISLMYTWVFVPVMNPDGYEYSHSTDRLWRKNRRGSHGVDLNRNYGIAFGAYCPDKSNKEHREYCGDGPFSEPESYAMSLYTKENSDNLEYYLSFHSYGQKMILPYSYTIEHKENYDLMKKKIDEVVKRISGNHGIKYTVGNNYDVNGYLASGTSSDWVKRALKVSYVVTFELPDTGVHGYALPTDRILPTCQATMEGLLLLFDPRRERLLRMSNGVTKDRMHVGISFAVLSILNVNFHYICCECKSYKNHALLRAVPYDDEQLVFLKTLVKIYNVIWWKEPTLVHNAVEFSISPHNLGILYRDTEKMTIRFAILIRNIESAFQKQKASHYFRRNMQSYNFHNYYRLDDIYEWLKDVSATHPSEVQLRRIGKTHQNRTIMGVRLTLKGSKNRSKVIVEGGCHAREWLSPAFVTYMLYTILNAKVYKDPELERIAYQYTWIFIPVMNPDGYEYSHTTDRLWRKNRRPGNGVDLNRNYGIAFGTLGTSKKPESESYCGDSPFSEPETYSMATMTREHRHRLEYYISIHSYGQFMILPYAHLIEHEDNFDKVKALVDKAAARISINHGIKYKTGTSFETVGYLASGLSADWVKRALNISYVLSIELPDTGVHGFALPPGRILPACQATMDGLLAVLTPQSDRFLRMHESAGQENRVVVEVVVLCYLFVAIVNN